MFKRLFLAMALLVLAFAASVQAQPLTSDIDVSYHHHRHHHHVHWRHANASWYYDDGGPTASGYRYTYGVADCGTDHVCYPFGTRIKFCFHGCVIARVDDHGPYVAGRDFDLDEATAHAIGFSGVHSVRYHVL